ncbi:putative late blight resistance protein homolog R1A-4 [Salvia miltiorrhiza]|uniref:putative late blight resistance protein homolog R1A-4 n=1 Tax=Salvia miltiorrhiza TaxID=226208 RepID=UPI0025AC5213|nr:putative late blight resistance protein homolog R1A-4 [Salvia miltiorrhiza]
MAYSTLVSLERTIDQFLNHNQFSISPHEKKHIISLDKYVIILQAFLEDFPEKAKSLEARMRNVAMEAEDVIELYMMEKIHYNIRYTHWIAELRRIKFIFQLRRIENQMDSIAGEVVEIKNSIITIKDAELDDSVGTSSSSSQGAEAGKIDMVGLNEDLIEIKAWLCGDSRQLQILPLTGMGGIGKTTLARNAYDDPLIMEHFEIRVWVTITQDYSEERILSNIFDSLKEFNRERDDRSMAEKVYKILVGRRFLIVMDDMWSTKVLNDVKKLFPDDNNGSRILLTTRLVDIAVYANSSTPSHKMRLMDPCQSWNLLREKVFGHQDSNPRELEAIGREITRSCGGLPLATVVVAGLLSSLYESLFADGDEADLLEMCIENESLTQMKRARGHRWWRRRRWRCRSRWLTRAAQGLDSRRWWGIGWGTLRLQVKLEYDDFLPSTTTALVNQEFMRSLAQQVVHVKSLLEGFPYIHNGLKRQIYTTKDVIEYILSLESNLEWKRSLKRAEKLKSTAGAVDSCIKSSHPVNNVQRLSDTSTAVGSSSRRELTRKDDVVGIQRDLSKIKEQLTRPSVLRLKVLPIVGMGGIGKTTLAKLVYSDKLIMEHFQIRGWVTISQDYSVTSIVSNLLASMKGIQGVQSKISGEEEIHRCLRYRRYLIVVDDVWSKKAWDDIKKLFPDNNYGSRIILTTRLQNVAAYADPSNSFHMMRPLSQKASWGLLQKRVFGGRCPHIFLSVGREIAAQCRGLPLYIVVKGYRPKASIENFSLLKILHVLRRNDYWEWEPSQVFDLIHLTYLAANIPTSIVPPTISKLHNLQTLIIYRSEVRLPVEIWRLSQLRHLIAFSFHPLPHPEVTAIPLANLQTFSLATDFVCVEMIPNIQKLGICYSEEKFSEGYHPGNLFGNLFRLEKLKLERHNSFCGSLNFAFQFPLSLKKLTLIGWKLPWSHMKIVGSLPNLQELKLRKYACNGKCWETSKRDFVNLRLLLIDESNLRLWRPKSHHFPRLKCLMLLRCPDLSEIPIALGYIPTLELIEVDDCNKSLLKSAREIQRARQSNYDYGLHVRTMRS